MPQRNCTSQAAACNTLAVYSNAARYFVAVCPSGLHRDTGERVDASTSTSRSSPRPTLEKMLTSRSFHTLQSSALDKLRRRKRGECKGDTSGKSDWCRETVFPELYFGGLVEALEEHMADGDLVFPEGK